MITDWDRYQVVENSDCVDLVQKFKKLKTANVKCHNLSSKNFKRISRDDLQKFDCCAGKHSNKRMFYLKDGTVIKKVLYNRNDWAQT